jgi:hypothetical protein
MIQPMASLSFNLSPSDMYNVDPGSAIAQAEQKYTQVTRDVAFAMMNHSLPA